MRIVVAIGGNALLPRGGSLDASVQLEQLAGVAPDLGELASNNQVVIVHGNGPQVGMLAVQSSGDDQLSRPYPLDDLVAETQGMIGYWLQQALANHSRRGAVTLISQTIVDLDDPAFGDPSKFIGPVYDRATADRYAAEYGWQILQDGSGWRRVVASPVPYEVVETDIAVKLLESGTTVILAGGGGIPVAYQGDRLVGVEAVVDKDLVAATVAEQIFADLFVILTDVPGVMTGFATAEMALVRSTTPDRLEELDLPAGSMGPKAQAVARFVRNSGRRAAIGSLAELHGVVAGTHGTQVALGPVRERLLTGRSR
ncbi:carbamate kinase [Methylocystis sp.]|uniref:carbamate kinase n=1 Tax=Methylocystis sp. TaxID=1911079 RepID=UPI003DA63D46